jgi:hypothetical protein
MFLCFLLNILPECNVYPKLNFGAEKVYGGFACRIAEGEKFCEHFYECFFSEISHIYIVLYNCFIKWLQHEVDSGTVVYRTRH